MQQGEYVAYALSLNTFGQKQVCVAETDEIGMAEWQDELEWPNRRNSPEWADYLFLL